MDELGFAEVNCTSLITHYCHVYIPVVVKCKFFHICKNKMHTRKKNSGNREISKNVIKKVPF